MLASVCSLLCCVLLSLLRVLVYACGPAICCVVVLLVVCAISIYPIDLLMMVALCGLICGSLF